MRYSNPFDPDWLPWLRRQHNGARGLQLQLLLDGVFRPGLWQTLQGQAELLDHCDAVFRHVAGSSQEALEVSPVVVRYQPDSARLDRVLKACDGLPMVSLIVTSESTAELARRLAAWCVVEADGSAFNFRYPDTRRLPDIAQSLRPGQRRHLVGPAAGWYCVGRDGRWMALPLDHGADAPLEGPRLDARQFGDLVDAGEADAMLAILQPEMGDALSGCLPSVAYASAQEALRLADSEGVQELVERLARVRGMVAAVADYAARGVRARPDQTERAVP